MKNEHEIKQQLVIKLKEKYQNDWRVNEFIEFIDDKSLNNIIIPCRFQHFEDDIKLSIKDLI